MGLSIPRREPQRPLAPDAPLVVTHPSLDPSLYPALDLGGRPLAPADWRARGEEDDQGEKDVSHDSIYLEFA